MTLPAACLIGACANPSHLVVYQHSNLGVNAGVSPATNNLHVRVGLRREYAAVIPKYESDTRSEPAAASSFVVGRMRVAGAFKTPETTEVIATGNAAIQAAGGGGLPKFIQDVAATDPTDTSSDS